MTQTMEPKGTESTEWNDEIIQEALDNFDLVVKLVQCSNLREFSEKLTNGVPDQVLEDVIRIISLNCMIAAETYDKLAKKGQGGFVRKGSLPFLVLEGNPALSLMQSCYDKTCVLMDYADEQRREILTHARVTVAAASQLVYDRVVWSD